MPGTHVANVWSGYSYSNDDYHAIGVAGVQMTMFLGRLERTGPADMKAPARNVVDKIAALVAAVDSVRWPVGAAHWAAYSDPPGVVVALQRLLVCFQPGSRASRPLSIPSRVAGYPVGVHLAGDPPVH